MLLRYEHGELSVGNFHCKTFSMPTDDGNVKGGWVFKGKKALDVAMQGSRMQVNG